MRRLIITLLLSTGVLLQSCVSTRNQVTKWRNLHTFQSIKFAIRQGGIQFDGRLKDFGKYAKMHQNNQKSREKISNNARLGQRLGHIDGDILRIRNALQINERFHGTPFTVKVFLDPKRDYLSVSWLQKQFDEYIRLLLERVPQKYIADTTSWSRRYIKQLPPEQQKNPPSFAEFYFKGASQEEALVVLSTLQLGILQEALEIQEKILKE